MTDRPPTQEHMDPIDAAAFMVDKVGTELYTRAATEVDGCIPPWAMAGVVKMDAEAIRALMIAAWLRGHAARGEALS